MRGVPDLLFVNLLIVNLCLQNIDYLKFYSQRNIGRDELHNLIASYLNGLHFLTQPGDLKICELLSTNVNQKRSALEKKNFFVKGKILNISGFVGLLL